MQLQFHTRKKFGGMHHNITMPVWEALLVMLDDDFQNFAFDGLKLGSWPLLHGDKQLIREDKHMIILIIP